MLSLFRCLFNTKFGSILIFQKNMKKKSIFDSFSYQPNNEADGNDDNMTPNRKTNRTVCSFYSICLV